MLADVAADTALERIGSNAWLCLLACTAAVSILCVDDYDQTRTNHAITEKYTMMQSNSYVDLIGRIFISLIFLISGLGKLGQIDATQGFMASAGISPSLLPLVIAVEVLGALAVIVGWQTRLAALMLGVFTLLTAFLFHAHFQDPMQMQTFMKNIAIAGGFMLLFVNGAGVYSLDARRALPKRQLHGTTHS